ncbi:MAG: universal stress protein [Thermodesulfobacteriota bacterium]
MDRFKNIVVIADGHKHDSHALKRALNLAEHNQARLTLLDVIPHLHGNLLLPPKGYSVNELEKMIIKNRKEDLDRIIRELNPGIWINSEVVMGEGFHEIIRSVQEQGFDLVMKSVVPEDRLVSFFFGSTDMHLLRQCPCPVWMIKTENKKNYKRILTAIDISPGHDESVQEVLNLQLLEMAASLALSEFCELHIIHAWQVFSESMMRASRLQLEDAALDSWLSDQKTVIENRQQEFVARFPKVLSRETMEFLTPKSHLIQGSAHKVIPAFAAEHSIDLVVMGTVGRAGVAGLFMGNTAENILNQLNCSVIAVKPKGFISPVK